MMKHCLAAILLSICSLAYADKPLPAQGRTVMGWLEPVVVEPTKFIIRAKLDTGAKTSSLHARNVETFRRDGHSWARFRVEDVSTQPEHNSLSAVIVERPLTRIAKVKRHGQEPEQRPVVNLAFCLNGLRYESEFTLIDRAGFNYPMLLGRSFLKNIALVDSSTTGITREKLKACADGKALLENVDDDDDD